MYLAIDIGGTKTIAAKLSDDGQILTSQRFASDHDYGQFLTALKVALGSLQLADEELHCCVGVPALLNRESGIAHVFGNLPWRDVPIRDDISVLIGGAPVLLENDARLAGLSEAQLLKDTYSDILFATVSTGIGGAFIQNGRIATALRDTEMGKMPLLYNGVFTQWEEFAGGRAVVQRFHKNASEITDPAAWHEIGENIAYGLSVACSVLQPDAIILGGSVGAQAEKYATTIVEFLRQHMHPIVRQPKAILAAQRPDNAVIFGCYDLAKQHLTSEHDQRYLNRPAP